MRTIQTTYSLEPFISRLPSVYPSYNGSDELLCFDKDSIDKRDGRYTSNYGMVPINIPFKLLKTINQNLDCKFDDMWFFSKDKMMIIMNLMINRTIANIQNGTFLGAHFQNGSHFSRIIIVY